MIFVPGITKPCHSLIGWENAQFWMFYAEKDSKSWIAYANALIILQLRRYILLEPELHTLYQHYYTAVHKSPGSYNIQQVLLSSLQERPKRTS